MTNSPLPSNPAVAPARIRLPGLASALLAVAPCLLVFGGLTFMGTSSRGFFARAAFQASLGAGIALTGLVLLASGLVLVGVRTMLQQLVDRRHGQRP